jgi:hypothetical protein
MKKVGEHIFYFLLTLVLTFFTAQIPILRDTHRFVKTELEIQRTHYRINNNQEITYNIINKGNLSLDDQNTFLEYKSNQAPTLAFLFDENGNTDTIKLSKKIPEPFRISYPDWLKSRENVSLRVIYNIPYDVVDEAKIKFSRDGKFSTIPSIKEGELTNSNLKSRVDILIWALIFMLFALLLITVYWLKAIIPKIKDWHYNELTKRFISTDKKFLTDEDNN